MVIIDGVMWLQLPECFASTRMTAEHSGSCSRITPLDWCSDVMVLDTKLTPKPNRNL